ncbi:phage baseplate assembly protein domain-containing protein [Endozoicomonas acroporae]|uniref:phage baseplate assembly protein domain-containing protein n=1 Tax=Endozoicomonas acroporae TaxID=1701104 RepID=UPI0013D0D0DB|nr:phage baseplate assembly protein [Endozoicomonas acroporae]
MFKDIARRLARKILTGIVRLSYDDTGLQTLQVTFKSGDTWEKIPRYQNYGFTHRPKKGAQAVGLFIDEDNGLVVAVDDRRYRLQGLKEGEVAMYDDLGNKVVLGREGLEMVAVTRLAITSPQTELNTRLTVNGDTHFNGKVSANGKRIDESHKHPGDSGGTTGAVQ